jgi:hypothetical protein
MKVPSAIVHTQHANSMPLYSASALTAALRRNTSAGTTGSPVPAGRSTGRRPSGRLSSSATRPRNVPHRRSPRMVMCVAVCFVLCTLVTHQTTICGLCQ